MARYATTSTNVLTALDRRKPTSFYWSLTLLATLGGFLFGYDTANIGSALNFVPYHLTGFAQGYLVAGASYLVALIIFRVAPGSAGFPTSVRGQAAAIAAAVDWIANFALIEVLPTWQSGVGLGWVLVSFAALCVVAVLFVRTWLPETKGHSADEIIQLFEKEARA